VNLHKDVGYECLPDEYLPDDYEGPRAGSYSEITGTTSSTMNVHNIKNYHFHCGDNANIHGS